MKKFLLLLAVLCLNATAAITDLKIGTAQIFDVQWSMSGTTLNVSNMTRPFISVPSGRQMTTSEVNTMTTSGQYFKFFSSTTNPGTYGMAIYNSDDTINRVIHNTGSFSKFGNGVIFYQGNNMWGTIISTQMGYSYGNSASFTGTYTPTSNDINNYTPPSSTPLAAGQSAQQGGGGGSAPVYTSDITTTQTTQITSARTRVAATLLGNKIYLEQKIGTSGSVVNIEQSGSYNTIQGLGVTNATIDGTSNTVNIKQGSVLGKNMIEFSIRGNTNSLTVWQSRHPLTGAGYSTDVGGHYAGVSLDGSSNTVTIKQVNAGGVSSGHYESLTVVGSSNNLVLKQGENSDKKFFGSVTGSNNVFDVTQQGTGNQYLDLTLVGNGHSATINQAGTGSHKATISLTNAGGASTLNLTQQGSTAQTYSILQSCATLSGCSVSITQGQ